MRNAEERVQIIIIKWYMKMSMSMRNAHGLAQFLVVATRVTLAQSRRHTHTHTRARIHRGANGIEKRNTRIEKQKKKR